MSTVIRLAVTLVVGTLAGLLHVGSAGPAYACSCADWSDASAAESADIVFVGELVEIDRDLQGRYDLFFEVDDVYRGTVDAEQWMRSNGTNSCDFEPVAEGRHLVFAVTGPDGSLAGLGCAPTRPLATDAEVELGTPYPPEQSAWGWLRDPTLLLAAALAILLGVAALVRRWRWAA